MISAPRIALALLALATPALAGPISGGAGNLLVTPTRVMLEGSVRNAAMTLRNTGAQAALYRISLEHARMDSEGRISRVEEPGPEDHDAAELLRFSPRQVLLQAGETQVIRIMVRKPADLPAGEYRSQMVVRAVPSDERPAPSAAEPGRFSVELTPVYGVAIPVIVRHGETSATVSIASATLIPGQDGKPPAVRVELVREGTASVHGDLNILAGSGRSQMSIGRARGLAVWTPNPARAMTVPIRAEFTATAERGDLVVTYSTPDGREMARSPVGR